MLLVWCQQKGLLPKQKKFTKRQKRKTREENLLEKAITIMKSASNTSKPI